MKSIFVAAAALASLAAGPAFAEPSAAAAKPAAEASAAAPSPGKKFCFKDDMTGTRIAKTVCKTRAEWVADGVDMREFDR